MLKTAKQIGELAKQMGLPVISTAEPNDQTDGEVLITDKVHLQVGFDYLICVVSDRRGSQRYGTTRPMQQAINVIAEAKSAL